MDDLIISFCFYLFSGNMTGTSALLQSHRSTPGEGNGGITKVRIILFAFLFSFPTKIFYKIIYTRYSNNVYNKKCVQVHYLKLK